MLAAFDVTLFSVLALLGIGKHRRKVVQNLWRSATVFDSHGTISMQASSRFISIPSSDLQTSPCGNGYGTVSVTQYY